MQARRFFSFLVFLSIIVQILFGFGVLTLAIQDNIGVSLQIIDKTLQAQDLDKITINCDKEALINQTIACSGNLPSNLLPPIEELALNVAGQNSQICTFGSMNFGANFSCNNLLVGPNSAQNVPIQASINKNPTTNTNQTVNIIAPINDASCGNSKACFLYSDKFIFSPKILQSVYGTRQMQLQVLPNLYQSAPGNSNKYICRISLKAQGKSDDNSSSGYAVFGSKLQGGRLSSDNIYQDFDYDNGSGGCVATLPANQQNIPYFYWKIQVMELNSSGNLTGNWYQAEPSYFFLYGAVAVLSGTVSS